MDNPNKNGDVSDFSPSNKNSLWEDLSDSANTLPRTSNLKLSNRIPVETKLSNGDAKGLLPSLEIDCDKSQAEKDGTDKSAIITRNDDGKNPRFALTNLVAVTEGLLVL